MLTIKIFSAATGPYKKFITPFIQSFNSLFFRDCKKEFVIFTDREGLNTIIPFLPPNIPKIDFIETTHEPWPAVTLKRYELINQYLEDSKYNSTKDLYLWVDIDMECITPIEYNPSISTKRFVAVQHPGNYVTNMLASLENNKESKAYVDIDELPSNYHYVQGCLWGGLGHDFKLMVGKMRDGVTQDHDNQIVAKWHDESHLNKFIIENYNSTFLLPASFAFPQNWKLEIPAYIIHKDKNNEEFPRFEGDGNK